MMLDRIEARQLMDVPQVSRVRRLGIGLRLFVVILMVLAVIDIALSLGSIPLRSAAGDLDSARSHEPDLLDHLLIASCRPDLITAAKVNAVSAMTLVRASGQIPAETLTARIEDELRRVTSCAPFDGDAWARVASIGYQRSGDTPAVRSALALSSWTAPNEGTAIRTRISVMSRLVATGDPDLLSDLTADIRRFTKNEPVGDILSLYASSEEPIRRMFRDAAQLLLDANKRAQLQEPMAR